MGKCAIIQDGNELILSFPYDPGMVAELKSSISASDRRYDPAKKVWRVAPNAAAKVQNLCNKHFNELPLLPQFAHIKPVIKQQIIDVRYIGLTKDRGGDDRSAYGYFKNGWNVIFPEPVLRTWFDAPQNPNEMPTLYSVLMVGRDATPEQIKAGYRRMVMQWHPDKCHEPNARDQFEAIQHAYEILSTKRARYDAGLALEASLRNNPTDSQSYDRLSDGYRSPLRCGLIMCEGVESLGVFNVSKIFAWEDIRDNSGRVLVVSWPKDAKIFEEVWFMSALELLNDKNRRGQATELEFCILMSGSFCDAETAAEQLATLERKANDVPEYEAEITRLRLRADKRTDEIIELQAAIKQVESNYDALQTPMPCGHLARYAVNEKAGTQYCALCVLDSTQVTIANLILADVDETDEKCPFCKTRAILKHVEHLLEFTPEIGAKHYDDVIANLINDVTSANSTFQCYCEENKNE